MRTIVFFTILFACAVMTACGDVSFLVKEGLAPAAKTTVDSSSIKSGAQLTVQQSNLSDALHRRRLILSGLEPGRTLVFIQFDNRSLDRTVEEDETIVLLVPTNSNVTVTYVYGDHGKSRRFSLSTTYDYRWDPSTKTFTIQP